MNFKRSFFLFTLCIFAAKTEASEDKKIRVYADMVGDLFHAGHVEFFKKARAFGDYLVVGILADESVEEYKRTPILTLKNGSR
jgi:cytidyltransferase-like protein